MNVLIGCETSGVVREAFRARGHSAYSCDVLPADDGSPYHLQCNLLYVLDPKPDSTYYRGAAWDLLIVHLPCTYFCNSGVWALTRTPPRPSPNVLYGAARWAALEKAIGLWLEIAKAPIPRIAMENPIPHRHARERIGPYAQTIQPYEFGDDASKRTCLWLKALPPLVRLARSSWIEPRYVDGRPRWSNQTDSGQNKLTPSADRWQQRARTYPGIARAMAAQWG